MVSKPPVPDEFEIPTAMNGWVHDPDSNRNGHVWTGQDAKRSVCVFTGVADTVRVSVFDDRVDGYANNIRPAERDIDPDETEAEATAWGVSRAVNWMRRFAPSDWDHPDVDEAVFDPPAGFVLDRYYLEQRNHTIYYRREGADRPVRMAGVGKPTAEPSVETWPFLYLKVWRGSGNATIGIAPWLRADDNEIHEVVDAPDECGLAVALKLAREHVAEETGQTRDTPASGQAGLSSWS